MFSTKKLVFLLALLLVTLLPNVVARPAFAQEGAGEEEVKDEVVEEGYMDAALGVEEAELVPEGDSLGCVGTDYRVPLDGRGIRETPRGSDYYYTDGGAACGREIRIRPTNRHTWARIKFFPRNGEPSHTAWTFVLKGQVGVLARNVIAGTRYRLQVDHRASGAATYLGRISD